MLVGAFNMLLPSKKLMAGVRTFARLQGNSSPRTVVTVPTFQKEGIRISALFMHWDFFFSFLFFFFLVQFPLFWIKTRLLH